MNFRMRWVASVVVLGLVACADHSGEQGGGLPTVEPIQDSSFSFLQAEVDDASRGLQTARQNLDVRKPEAKESLDRAEEALQRIAQYYIPLLEARERAVNTELLWHDGQVDRAKAELNRIEEILLDVGGNLGAKPESLGQAVEAVGEARLAVTSNQEGEIPGLLRGLTEQLAEMLFKGRLVLRGEKMGGEEAQPAAHEN